MLGLIAEMPWWHFVGDTGWCAIVPPAAGSGGGRNRAVVAPVDLPLRVGARTLGTLRRNLVRRPFSLAEALSQRLPTFEELPEEAQGYLVTSIPIELMDKVRAAHPDLVAFIRQHYPRSFTALDGSHEDWLKSLSSRSRSTLKRKIRRFAEADGGRIDLRCFRDPEEMAEFHRLARSISERTYQERLLACGLPDGPEFLDKLRSRAEAKAVLGWVLFLGNRPVSYLHAPAEGDVLIYDHLGYDPDFADLSPGTILQAGVMRQLFDEKAFRLFDFTEGSGRHKQFFATGHVDCADLLLLRRTHSNLVTGRVLDVFDSTVGLARDLVRGLGLHGLARRTKR